MIQSRCNWKLYLIVLFCRYLPLQPPPILKINIVRPSQCESVTTFKSQGRTGVRENCSFEGNSCYFATVLLTQNISPQPPWRPIFKTSRYFLGSHFCTKTMYLSCLFKTSGCMLWNCFVSVVRLHHLVKFLSQFSHMLRSSWNGRSVKKWVFWLW